MFYSHEVLTQRKYGVATIWLVATLGSKSGLKKVHRKDILSVNVPKACETVIKPDVPLALRLQSNLLYGISRVYSGQCDYLVNDVSMVHMNIKRMIRSTTIKAANLDLVSSGRTRPEHLVLNDDPEFLPEINLAILPEGIELIIDDGGAIFALDGSPGISSFERTDSMHSFAQVGSLVGPASGTPRLNLVIPSSDTVFGDYGFLPGSSDDGEETGNRILDNVGFVFDTNGEMIEIPMLPKDSDSVVSGRVGSVGPLRMRRGESVQSFGRGSRLNSEDIARQVLLEHEEGRVGDLSSHMLDGNDNTYAPPDEDIFNIGAEPFRTGIRQPSTNTDMEGTTPIPKKSSSRNKKFIIDDVTEIRIVELKAWRENYLSNMEAAARRLQAWKIGRNAKRNAKNILFGIGFFGELKNPILKSLFSAESLLDHTNKKRKRAVGIEEGGEIQGIGGDEERRVRARIGERLEEEIGLGNNLGDEYELPMNQLGDELEIGREGPEPASDGIRPSSQAVIPWNVMSEHKSHPGSLIMSGGLLPSVGGFPSSSIGGSQMDFISRRAPRASAIKGGFERLSVLGSPIGERDEAMEELDLEFTGEEMGFEYFGAGANVDTQTAQNSQWLAATVEQESTNFFGFLKTEYAKNKQQAEDNDEEPVEFITFEELLDPTQNGKIVAAQAFHHTLLLATKGLVYVSQEENYGSIQISILSSGKI